MIFILLYASEKSRLLWLLCSVAFQDVIPITTKHCVCLTTASLTIGKDCYIIAFTAFGKESLDIWENGSLCAFGMEYFIQLLLPFDARHGDHECFLGKGRCTESLQVIDYFYSDYERRRGLILTIVAILTVDLRSLDWSFYPSILLCYKLYIRNNNRWQINPCISLSSFYTLIIFEFY